MQLIETVEAIYTRVNTMYFTRGRTQEQEDDNNIDDVKIK